ncbi:MAG: hypothetical protein Q9221_004484 [Calogaya cf. arnoldii]
MAQRKRLAISLKKETIGRQMLDFSVFNHLLREDVARRNLEMRTRWNKCQVMSESVPAVTGNEDDDKALAQMGIQKYQPKLKSFEEMYQYIANLTKEQILEQDQSQLARKIWDEREREAFSLWSKEPLVDRGKINLVYHMLSFDAIFFDSQLQRWISRIEWDENMNPTTDGVTETYWEAQIRIRPQKLLNGEYDYSAILDTLLHEMLHVMNCLVLAEGSTGLSQTVHMLGFAGHGPKFRAMGAKIQALANGLLFKREVFMQSEPQDLGLRRRNAPSTKSPGGWHLNVLAYGGPHKLELQAIAQSDPSTLGGVEDWDFDEIQGKDTPYDAIAKGLT